MKQFLTDLSLIIILILSLVIGAWLSLWAVKGLYIVGSLLPWPVL